VAESDRSLPRLMGAQSLPKIEQLVNYFLHLKYTSDVYLTEFIERHSQFEEHRYVELRMQPMEQSDMSVLFIPCGYSAH